jgi:hypothetical protein
MNTCYILAATVPVCIHQWNSSLHHSVQNGFGAHPASYPMGTRGSYPGGKAAGGVEVPIHLHLGPRARMRGDLHRLSQYAFVVWCSEKHRDSFTFTNMISHAEARCQDKITRPMTPVPSYIEVSGQLHAPAALP